jgi:predicted dehydrogenase
MKINLIIGAGQLGSRHLQGLLKLNVEQVIYVLDTSLDSLKISKAREEEIHHNNQIHYFSEWDLLPKDFDLVIIATSANVRAKVVKQLIESSSVSRC